MCARSVKLLPVLARTSQEGAGSSRPQISSDAVFSKNCRRLHCNARKPELDLLQTVLSSVVTKSPRLLRRGLSLRPSFADQGRRGVWQRGPHLPWVQVFEAASACCHGFHCFVIELYAVLESLGQLRTLMLRFAFRLCCSREGSMHKPWHTGDRIYSACRRLH